MYSKFQQAMNTYVLKLYIVVKVGGGTDQGSATEVTHLRLDQPPVFPVIYSTVLGT